MVCGLCGADVSWDYHLGVRLTIVCKDCVFSDDLVTKRYALARGVRAGHLKHINWTDETPYKRAPRMYVREELGVLRHMMQKAEEKKKNATDAKKSIAKKARTACYNKRLASLDGVVPTPGLVSGDFCSTSTKRPTVGTRLLTKRRALWNRCSHLNIAATVQVFNWATANNKLEISATGALSCIGHEQYLFDKIATTEGHRVLQFLGETERLVLLKINPTFEESRHDLPVKTMPDGLLNLCGRISCFLHTPLDRVVSKLEQSKDCWFYQYMYRMTPRRLSRILAPHFHGPSTRKAMLERERDESFSRWGLSASDNVYLHIHRQYFRCDIVDVELYTAWCYLSKHCINTSEGMALITSRVLSEPGLTWIEATKQYADEELLAMDLRQRERSERGLMGREDKVVFTGHCSCGSPAAKKCMFRKCRGHCPGPCVRHRK